MCRLALVCLLMVMSLSVKAEPLLKVAVASNFSTTAAKLFKDFQQNYKVEILSLIGSTGKHVAQIQHGLEVDILLSADRARPEWLERNGLAVKGSRFTYASGQIALFSLDKLMVEKAASGNFKSISIAIANPKIAPYGEAAIEVLKSYKVIDDAGITINNDFKIVKGESVGQAFQFAASGAANIALIAHSQALEIGQGYSVLISNLRHAPIEQQAITIRASKAAEVFMTYLKSPQAQSIIQRSGYRRAQ